MRYDDLRATWYEEEQKAFSGWDFSHLDSRWHHEPMGWDYRAIIANYLLPSYQVLDMGTGGGEFLLSLHHPHSRTSVTEGWEPNVALCKERLEPLGIRVYQVSDDQLPIDDDSFDVVINRHESYDLQEVSRVLKPGGVFVTQQVGGDDCLEFARRLNPSRSPLYGGFSLSSELHKFPACGLSIEYSAESHPELRFFDVGAVVFFAKIIEWTFPGFSVDNNFEQLCSLQDELLQTGFLTAIQHRFIVVAKNVK